MIRSTVLCLTVLALSLSFASRAEADYLTSYGNGLQALEKEQWLEAADWFRKAIAEQPQAGGRVSVAGQRQKYTPHYQLGLALYRAGKLRAASDAWRESAVQDALSKKRQELVNQYLFDIEERLEAEYEESEPQVELERQLSAEEVKSRQRSAQRQLDRAARQIQKLAAPDLRAILEADPQLVAQRDLGVEKLQEARQIFETAGASGDPIALQEVHARAVDAAGRLENVVLSATMALPPEVVAETGLDEPARGEVLADAPEALATAGTELDAPPAGTELDPALAEAMTEPLPGEVGSAEEGGLPGEEGTPGEEGVPVAGAEGLAPGEATLDDTTEPGVPPSAPPAFLRDAATAFFSARYDDVLALLEEGDLGDQRVRKHAHLFRAAARYALYLLGDRQDASHLQAAEAEARACRALDPGLKPPAEGFSPSFVRFFESNG